MKFFNDNIAAPTVFSRKFCRVRESRRGIHSLDPTAGRGIDRLHNHGKIHIQRLVKFIFRCQKYEARTRKVVRNEELPLQVLVSTDARRFLP